MPGKYTSIGAVGVSLTANTRNFVRQTQNAAKQTKRQTLALREMRQQMHSVNRTARRLVQDHLRNASLTLALGFTVRKVTKDFLAFDSALVRQRSLVGLSTREVQKMREEILRIAPALGRAPKELAEGLFFITSAGLRGTVALQTLRSSAEASAIGLGEVKSVADAVTTALNAYGSANLSAREATAILVATVREGKLEAEELAPQLGRVVAIASELGVEFHEVGAAFASLSRTMRTEQATIALTGILKPLLKPTEQAKDALARMGFTIEELRDRIANGGIFQTLQELRRQITRFGVNLGDLFRDQYGIIGLVSLTGANFQRTEEIAKKLAETVGVDLTDAFNKVADSVDHRFRRAITNLTIQGDRLASVGVPAFSKYLSEVLSLLIAVVGFFAGGVFYKAFRVFTNFAISASKSGKNFGFLERVMKRLGVRIFKTQQRIGGMTATLRKSYRAMDESQKRAYRLSKTLGKLGEAGATGGHKAARRIGGIVAFLGANYALSELLNIDADAKNLESVVDLAQQKLDEIEIKIGETVARINEIRLLEAGKIGIRSIGSSFVRTDARPKELREAKRLEEYLKKLFAQREELQADISEVVEQQKFEEALESGFKEQEKYYKRLIAFERARIRETRKIADIQYSILNTIEQHEKSVLSERRSLLGTSLGGEQQELEAQKTAMQGIIQQHNRLAIAKEELNYLEAKRAELLANSQVAADRLDKAIASGDRKAIRAAQDEVRDRAAADIGFNTAAGPRIEALNDEIKLLNITLPLRERLTRQTVQDAQIRARKLSVDKEANETLRKQLQLTERLAAVEAETQLGVAGAIRRGEAARRDLLKNIDNRILSLEREEKLTRLYAKANETQNYELEIVTDLSNKLVSARESLAEETAALAKVEKEYLYAQENAIQTQGRLSEQRKYGSITLSEYQEALAKVKREFKGYTEVLDTSRTTHEQNIKQHQAEIATLLAIQPLTNKEIQSGIERVRTLQNIIEWRKIELRLNEERLEGLRQQADQATSVDLAELQGFRDAVEIKRQDAKILRERIETLQHERRVSKLSGTELEVANYLRERQVRLSDQLSDALRTEAVETQNLGFKTNRLIHYGQLYIVEKSKLSQQLKDGTLTQEQYNYALETATAKYEGYTQQLKDGTAAHEQNIQRVRALIAELRLLIANVPDTAELQIELETTKAQEQLEEFQKAVEGHVINSLEDVIFESKKVGDAIKALAAEIIKEFIRIAVIRPIANLIAGAIASGFSGAFGGAGAAAAGGYHSGLTVVGELGPELVDFNRPARVYTNRQLNSALGDGGGSGITIVNNIKVESTDGPGVRRALAEAEPRLIRATTTAVASKVSRPSALQNTMRRNV